MLWDWGANYRMLVHTIIQLLLAICDGVLLVHQTPHILFLLIKS